MSGSGSSTGNTAGAANGPGATTNPSGSTIGGFSPMIDLNAFRFGFWYGTLSEKAPRKARLLLR
jgi:hypothetical protein